MIKYLTVAVFCTYVGAAWTHHSIDADFAPGASITISAVTKEFRFVNPHPFLTATELADEGEGEGEGEGEDWMLVLDDRWEMVEAGFSRSTFQPGDELIVTGRPSRREPNTLYVRVLERKSDGFIYAEDDGEDYDD